VGTLHERIKHNYQFFRVYRFDEVKVKPCRLRSPSAFLIAPGGHGDKNQRAFFFPSQADRYLVPVHSRHVKVDNCNAWTKFLRSLQGAGPVVTGACLKPDDPQNRNHGIGIVAIIVNAKNPKGWPLLVHDSRSPAVFHGGSLRQNYGRTIMWQFACRKACWHKGKVIACKVDIARKE
jgi:hypothetical protein